MQHNAKRPKATIAAYLAIFALFYPVQSIHARPCGKDPLSRLGCAVDPTNPSDNGGLVRDSLKCKSWWNCDANQIQINKTVIAAKQSGLIRNREECKAYVRKTIGIASEQLQGVPGLDFFLRRGTDQGNDSCDLQFPATAFQGSRDAPFNQAVIRAPRWGGLCLDIANPEGKGPQNGAPVLAFQCHGGGNQMFQVSSDGTIRAPRWGGLCLDISNPEGKGPQNGAPVLAFQCHGGGNQMFQVSSDGTIRAPRWGGLCLDISNPEGKGPQNGAPILAFQCHGGNNQSWSLGAFNR